jgi:hypothetical protein
MATNMKMAIFWDVAPCSLVDTDKCFRGAYFLHHQGDVGQYLPDYTTHNPRRQPYVVTLVTFNLYLNFIRFVIFIFYIVQLDSVFCVICYPRTLFNCIIFFRIIFFYFCASL